MGFPQERGVPTLKETMSSTGYQIATTKKFHTYEEGGGTPQSFCLAFIDEFEKQLFKKLLKWVNKKCKNFNIYNVLFSIKKIQKNTWRYQYFRPAYQTSWWYDLQFLRYRMWQTKIGSYGSFSALPPKNQKPEFWKNERNCWRYHNFIQAYQKPQSSEVWFLRYGVRETWFADILDHFSPFYLPPLATRKINILKK